MDILPLSVHPKLQFEKKAGNFSPAFPISYLSVNSSHLMRQLR
jgi:hypothetical protein